MTGVQTCALPISALSIESFVDNWDATSMFNCHENSSLLAPAITKLRRSLMEANNLPFILKSSQTFLECFATTLYLTTGIPPYALQTVQLQYARDGTSNRNFMLMNTTKTCGVYDAKSDKSPSISNNQNLRRKVISTLNLLHSTQTAQVLPTLKLLLVAKWGEERM